MLIGARFAVAQEAEDHAARHAKVSEHAGHGHRHSHADKHQPKPAPSPGADGETDWKNTSTDWNTATNWTGVGGGLTPPSTADVAWFKVVKSTNPNLSASAQIVGLYFQSTASSGYDITRTSTQTLTLTATGTSIGAETSNTNAVAIGASNTSGTNTIDVPIILGASSGSTQTFTQASGGTLVVNGIISGNIDTLALIGGGTGNFTFAGANTFTLASGITIDGGTLKLGNATALGVTGNSITVGSNQTATLDLNGQSIANAVSITGGGIGGNGALINSNTSTAATLSGTLDGSSTPTIGGSGNITISGQIIASGSSHLTKVGTGTVFFTNNTNNYTRPTDINAGVLNIQANNALGVTTQATVASGAALQIQGGITAAARPLTLNGTGISNDGAFRNISGNNSYTGLVTLGSATRINSDSGTLTLSNAGTITGATFGLTVGGVGNTTINSIIGTTSGTLTKDGTGTLTLTGTNTYTGLTTVSAGILVAGTNAPNAANGAFGNASTAVVLGNAATTTNNSSVSLLTGGAFTIGRAITVANQATTGTYTIGGNTDNNSTFSGLTTINQNLTVSQVANTGANALSITGGITSGNAGTKTVTFAGPGNINVGTTAISDGGGGTLALNVTGGKTTFNIANTYTGLTNITAGTLAEGVSNAILTGAVTVNGATAVFDLGASHTDSVGIVTLDGGGSITGTGTSALTSTGTFEMKSGLASAILAGSGIALNKTTAGTVTLSGANTYTGVTTIDGGILNAGSLANGGSNSAIGASSNSASNLVFGGGTLQYTGSAAASTDRLFTIGDAAGNSATLDASGGSTGTLTFTNGGSIAFGNTSAHTLNLTGINTGINTLAAIIGDNTGATSLTKSGGGTWVLSGSNTYTGGTTISAGLLQANNNNALGSVNGSLTVNGGVLDLNGKTVGVGNLTGSGGNIWNNATGTNVTFTIGNGNGTGGNYAGVIADHNVGTGTVALTKAGTGTITLSGANTYTGATIINNGILSLDNAGSTSARLANTTSITVNSGGTLQLASSSGSSNDRINNGAKMFLNAQGSSTVAFNTGGLSEHGASNNTAGIGALTLQSTSIIDMGNLASVIAFANSNSVLGNSAAWSGTLKIYDWSGTPVTGGGTDQLFIGSDTTGLAATQLAEVQFYSGFGTGAYGAGALILTNGEIVPTAIPEPSTWLAGSLALATLLYTQRRRISLWAVSPHGQEARFRKRGP